ncbi:MAG: fasciclin domain-containing protein [Chitinophagaceae bacterium]
MKKMLPIYAFCLLIAAVVFIGNSCKKVEIVQSTTGVVNIYQYLKNHPDQFSMAAKIVEKSGFDGFLNAYGSYTMFAPTNTAVTTYLAELSKTSVDQITEAEAKDIVKFHLLEDTLTTASFKDGKLPLATMFGQFLITSISNTGGTSSFNINRQALVVQGNILAGNGFIHAIDHVLRPATKTVAELVAADPNYSIFKQALVETGFYDTLNTINTTDPSRRYLTLLAETNQALLDSGMADFAALKAKYSHTGNPAGALDSLHIYVAYHIIPDAKYLADIVSASSHISLQPLEVLASKLDGERVLINDIDFNGTHENGVELDRPNSDISATNGVLHQAKAHFAPKVRVPTAVYWDVADFPEIRKLPAIFRRTSYTFAAGTVADITWEKTDSPNDLNYQYTGTATNFFVNYNDYLKLRVGATGARNFWYQFKTPLIVKGKYKVWVCYRAQKGSGSLGAPGGSYNPVQVSFDGQPLQRPVTFTDPRPVLSDGELDALGWKRYTSPATNDYMVGKYVGIIDVTTTDRHFVRLASLPTAGTGQDVNNLDMIHFIPVDQVQYLPRFQRDGVQVFF